jgi:hypothetical protein
MGFLKNFRDSGDFISAWEARFGSLSRDQLDMLREAKLGLYSSWVQVRDSYSGSVSDFIDELHTWAFPGPQMREYLWAFRAVFASALEEDPREGSVTDWLEKAGPVAPLYPPGFWFEEWKLGLMGGLYHQGTKDGREALSDEVIVGKDSIELIWKQVRRPMPGTPEYDEAQKEYIRTFRGDPEMVKASIFMRKMRSKDAFDYDTEEIEPACWGDGGTLTTVLKETNPLDPENPFIVVVHSVDRPIGEIFAFPTTDKAKAHAMTLRKVNKS